MRHGPKARAQMPRRSDDAATNASPKPAVASSNVNPALLAKNPASRAKTHKQRARRGRTVRRTANTDSQFPEDENGNQRQARQKPLGGAHFKRWGTRTASLPKNVATFALTR